MTEAANPWKCITALAVEEAVQYHRGGHGTPASHASVSIDRFVFKGIDITDVAFELIGPNGLGQLEMVIEEDLEAGLVLTRRLHRKPKDMDNRFTEYSDNQLMTAYQRECENNGWGSSRARYLAELQTELERRFDCSEIIDGDAMSLATKNVVLCDGKTTQTSLTIRHLHQTTKAIGFDGEMHKYFRRSNLSIRCGQLPKRTQLVRVGNDR